MNGPSAIVEKFIKCNTPWTLLPDEVRASLSNSEIEYSKLVKSLSTKCQMRYKGNLVQHVYRDEKAYYKHMVDHCNENLMLYPYHLSDIMIAMRITPFIYYSTMVKTIMANDRSYDSLPNFTAVDCLRVLGIGRNQYIDLMNQTRVNKGSGFNKLFKKRPLVDLLPKVPLEIKMEFWWVARVGVVTEEDVRRCSESEKDTLDYLIDNPGSLCGAVDLTSLRRLYVKGLVYFDVPIVSDDTVSLPPLDNFVMNRTLGDEIENLIYQVFQVLDKATSMKELSIMIGTEVSVVTNIVSLMCRLGFCRKHNLPKVDVHSSWNSPQDRKATLKTVIDFDKMDVVDDLFDVSPMDSQSDLSDIKQPLARELEQQIQHEELSPRLGFLFDSTLTAFLMMGNLTTGLKTHAVTMFEVGKLSDESMDSFISELGKISLNEEEQEGEAQRYFDHAQILHSTLQAIRRNDKVVTPHGDCSSPGVDLLRCESLLTLDASICHRLLQKNYSVLISMAPLSQEVSPVASYSPYHIGPFIPEMNSPWFKLFIYHKLGSGPPSLLMNRGFRLKSLPVVFQRYEKILVTCWGHDPLLVSTSSCLLMLNDALCNMSVFIQGHTLYASLEHSHPVSRHVVFPTKPESNSDADDKLLSSLRENCKLDIENGFGFITLVRNTHTSSIPEREITDATASELNEYVNDASGEDLTDDTECPPPMEWKILDFSYGLPLFDRSVNEAVCDTIINTDILSAARQHCFLQANMCVASELMDFIEMCNENSPLANFDCEAHISSRQSVALPKHAVIFDCNSGPPCIKLWKV